MWTDRDDFMLRSRQIYTTMKLSISLRRIAASLTLLSLLFLQLAIASYVCPVLAPAVVDYSDNAATSMPCHRGDHDQPSLCHVHASEIGNKLSLDKSEAPVVHAFLPVQMAQTIALSAVDPMIGNQRERLDVHLRSTEPPSTLLNCCFRI
jgi:hypothetical protein